MMKPFHLAALLTILGIAGCEGVFPIESACVVSPHELPSLTKPPALLFQTEADIEKCNYKKSYEVDMQLMVSSDGKATDVTLIKSSGNSCIDEATLDAMRTAKFRAAVRDGVPVDYSIMLGANVDRF